MKQKTFTIKVFKCIRTTKELGLKQASRIRKELLKEYQKPEYVVRMWDSEEKEK